MAPRLLQLAGEASDLDALHVHTPARSLYGVDEIGQRGSGVYDHGVIRPRRGAQPSNLAPVDLLYGPRAIRISVVGRDEVAVECHPLDPPARSAIGKPSVGEQFGTFLGGQVGARAEER